MSSHAARNLLQLHPRILPPLNEFTRPRPSLKLAILNKHAPPRQNDFRHALHANTLKHRIIHAHMVRLSANHHLLIRIKNHNIRIRPNRNGPLTRIKSKQFRGRSRNKLHKPIHRKPPAIHPARKNQTHPFFNSGPAIRNLSEIVPPKLLLLLKTKRTMIGRNNLQSILSQSLPKFLLIPFLPQRRRKNILGPLKSQHIHILERKIKILRTSLRISRQPAIPSLAHFLESVITRKMHDINRRPSHLRQSNRPRRSLSLSSSRPRKRMILRRPLSLSQRPLHNHVNRPAILRMHANHPAILSRSQHRPENRSIIQHENARISHKKLERRHPLAHQRPHLLHLRVPQFRNNAMKRIINSRLAVSLSHPSIKSVPKCLPFVLNSKINQRSSPAMRGRNCPRLKIISTLSPAKRHIQMRMHINPARHHITPSRINHPRSILGIQVLSDGNNLVAKNPHIAPGSVRSRNNSPAANNSIQSHHFP